MFDDNNGVDAALLKKEHVVVGQKLNVKKTRSKKNKK